ncbi:hypothetical protein ma204 [Moumouvirus australiensis]|uniref:Uncharacterized protein n=1 Tax=Moumouvirus australiensis TaxID=2109587 RepID=A0A2P1EL33_9VIRU|nr:hypothetical protein QKC55_gp700 [Moumouvirus australiensis]AVL94590.1 hypothetical protein ma204 [Moumouvirus australiensis]
MTNPQEESKYKNYYQPNDIYWGLGIENESYFILDEDIKKTGEYVKKNRKRERYSVDYNSSYDQIKLNTYLNKIFNDKDIYNIPQYVNSHTLSKTDLNGEHMTLYVVGKKYNPKFTGKTIHDLFLESNEIILKDFGNKYVFDGDTIEFITQDFYKTTVKNCVNELVDYKKNFILSLNKFLSQNNLPSLNFPKINYGLVQFKTNPNNINMFNNGTYHINITIPTKLNEFGLIENEDEFFIKHKNAIKIIKWMEPFIIALYGSPDVFSFEDDKKYSSGSLRLTASRYVSIGTYDTKIMKKGKQLNDPKTAMFTYLYDKSWYNKIYSITDYKQVDNIGYDINYAKHLNSGIEFRILDYFPEECLENLINFIILLLDHSLENKINISCYESDEWHEFTKNVLLDGYTSKIPYKLIIILNKVLKFPLINTSNIIFYINSLIDFLYTKYNNGTCSNLMSPNMVKPKLHNVNRYMWENNYLQYIPINNKNHIRVTKLYDIYQKMQNVNFTFDENDKLHNLLINTKINLIPDLSLELFYEELLKVCHKKINVLNY